MTVQIRVHDRIAEAVDPQILLIGDNSGDTVVFTFDDEWSDYHVKTVRFLMEGRFEEVALTGNICEIPPLRDTGILGIGVYAGDLRTTTPALVRVLPSVLDGDPVHEEPRADVYEQLLALIEAGAVKGEKGDTGDPGPNVISAATAVTLNGLLKGNGTTAAAAVAGLDYLAPSALEGYATETYVDTTVETAIGNAIGGEY